MLLAGKQITSASHDSAVKAAASVTQPVLETVVILKDDTTRTAMVNKFMLIYWVVQEKTAIMKYHSLQGLFRFVPCNPENG